MPLLGEAEVASACTGATRDGEFGLTAGNAQGAENLNFASAGATPSETCSTSPSPGLVDGSKSTSRRALLVNEFNSDFKIEESNETESAPLGGRGYALYGRVVGPIRTGRLLAPVATIIGEHVSRGPPPPDR